MKVGIIGSGAVGKALGHGFVTLGHEVKIGSRDPGKLKDWVGTAGKNASAGTFDEVARFGEWIVLATLWTGTKSAIQLAGPNQFTGKILIDTTNPLDFSTMPPALAVGGNDSAGEQVQRWLPDARVVKAFNIAGNAHMFRPQFPGGPPDMFIAGNDEGAKKSVTGLLKDFGWPTTDLGPIEMSRYLEPLAMIWIAIWARTQSSNHAFRLLRK